MMMFELSVSDNPSVIATISPEHLRGRRVTRPDGSAEILYSDGSSISLYTNGSWAKREGVPKYIVDSEAWTPFVRRPVRQNRLRLITSANKVDAPLTETE
jgi:hypothetical protein